MSFGVGQAMSRSVKANLTLKGKRITYFERAVEKSNKTSLIFSNENKFSHTELMAFRDQLKKEKRSLFKKRMILTTSVLIILIIS